MNLKNLNIKDKIRISEIQTINIDLIKDIQKNTLDKNKLNKFIDNLLKTGPLFIKIFYILYDHKFLINKILNNKNNINIDAIYDLKYKSIINKNKIENIINFNIKHLVKNDKLIFINNELLFEIYKTDDFIIKIKNNEFTDILNKDKNIINHIPFIINPKQEILIYKNINYINIFKYLENLTNFKNEQNNMLKFNKLINNLKIFDNIYISNNLIVKKLDKHINIKLINNLTEIQINLFILLMHMININMININFDFNNIYVDKSNNFYFLDYSNILYIDEEFEVKFRRLFNLILNYNDCDKFINVFLKNSLINNNTNQINTIFNHIKKNLSNCKNINIMTIIKTIKSYFIKNLILIDHKINIFLDIIINIENNTYNDKSINIFLKFKQYINKNKIYNLI